MQFFRNVRYHLRNFYQFYPDIKGDTELCSYYYSYNSDISVALFVYISGIILTQTARVVTFIFEDSVSGLLPLILKLVNLDAMYLLIAFYADRQGARAREPENVDSLQVQKSVKFSLQLCMMATNLVLLVTSYLIINNEGEPIELLWVVTFVFEMYASLWSHQSLLIKVGHMFVTNGAFCICAWFHGHFSGHLAAHIMVPLGIASAVIVANDRERKLNFLLRQQLDSQKRVYEEFFQKLLDPVIMLTRERVIFRNETAAELLGETLEGFYYTAQSMVAESSNVSLEECVRARLTCPEVSRDPIKQERYRMRDEADPSREKIVVMTLIESNFFSREKTVALVMHDITAELVQEEKRVEDKYKNMMLFSLSHELRTPLNILQNTLSLARRAIASPADHDCYRNGKGAWHYLRNKINDMLTYAQLLMGEFVLHEEEFSLPKFVGYMHKITAFLLHEKKASIQLVFATSPSLGERFTCDKERLEQVLFNLLRNAVKHTKAGFIELKVSSNGDKLVFEIADTGSGLPQDAINYILSKGNTDRSHEGKPCGLGLTVSQMICNKMAGEMTVTATAGKGTRFVFAVPFSRPPHITVRPSDQTIPGENCVVNSCAKLTMTPSDRGIRKLSAMTEEDKQMTGFHMRVLIVDDSEFNRMVARNMVGKHGFVTEEAENGQMAIERILRMQGRLDGAVLVLMDLDMPVMNGVEATRAIRRLSTRPRPYICALTAFASESERNSCMSAGMDWFLSKPLTKETLSALLERVRLKDEP